MKTDWWVMASPATPGNSHHAFRCKGQWSCVGPFEFLGGGREFADGAMQQIDRASVDAWYKAAIEAGAKDNGKPGLRPHYHAHYYGAFVIVSEPLCDFAIHKAGNPNESGRLSQMT